MGEKSKLKVVIAMDSFKGSLSSLEAGNAVREGIEKAIPDADVLVKPLADGGEGTVEALTTEGSFYQAEVCGPLGEKVVCQYGILPDKETAVIEMSGAAGITLLKEEDKNPLYTTTYGVGEVILAAMHHGCRHFIIGIGGSVTNDGGAGMLMALGYELMDDNGKRIPLGAIGLKELSIISGERVPEELAHCDFHIACDVTNPLCGEQGCSAIYGPQKGATPDMVKKMDGWLSHYAALAKTINPHADASRSGAGAAGGIGFAFQTFLNAKLESGVALVLEKLGLEEMIVQADIVVTGEGKIDAQTAMGKAPIGVAQIAKRYGKLVLGFGGCISKGASACNEGGIDAYFSILRNTMPLSEAMKKETAYQNLAQTAEQVFRLIDKK